jgi:CubicO group peptidase (beta-lactamase class C family)
MIGSHLPITLRGMASRRELLMGLGASAALCGCGGRIREALRPDQTEATAAPGAARVATVPTQVEGVAVAAGVDRWDIEKLKSAAEFVRQANSDAFVVMVDGQVLIDERWAGDDPRRDVASTQKSVVATLLSMAEDRRLLTLDTTVSSLLGKGWSKAKTSQEKPITLRHLVTMTSGLGLDLKYSKKPGAVWLYNTDAYQVTHLVLEKVTKKSMQALSDEWLFGPIGMKAEWQDRRMKDAKGRNLRGLHTSARDLAAFGQFIADRGSWNGTALVKRTDLLDANLRRSQRINESYGHLWWLNGQPSHVAPSGQRANAMLAPDAPRDMVAALGYEDQKCYVVPSERMVVTRIGNAAKDKTQALSGFDNELWKQLMTARIR